MIVLHVITGQLSPRVADILTRVVLADRGEVKHVVGSLTKDGDFRHALQDAGVEVHYVGPATPLRMPGALVRLIGLIRRTQPDVVMSWHYQVHALATLAAVASGLGANRVVWNVSGSSTNASNLTRKTRLKLMLLAVLSPVPRGIAADSRSNWQAHKSLGYRPRCWFRLYNSTSESTIEETSDSHHQFWRYASGAEPFTVRPGLFEQAFPWLEKRWVARLRRIFLTKPTVIAVTGSCGKSTTVKLAHNLLTTDGPCYRGRGNVPEATIRALLSVPAFSKYCVQEISGHFPGAIAEHVRVLRPHIGIVTTIGTDHYTNFRSLEATAKEKGGLVEALPKRGIAILNADDPHVRAMAARTHARVLLFGLSPDAEIRATEVSSAWPDRLSLTVVHGHESVRVQTKLVGEFWATSILAAIACGVACGIDLRTCIRIVETFAPIPGCNSVHSGSASPVYVLDNSKASFWTIAASLTFLARARAPRKTAIFGTISDMPGRGHKKYRQVARKALEVANRVIFVGSQADAVSKLLRQEGLQDRLFAFQTSYQASAFLAEDPLQEELIYIKASLTDHLERIMLSQLDKVVCWRERCRIGADCHDCRYFRQPHAPPFGLAERDSLTAAPSLQK